MGRSKRGRRRAAALIPEVGGSNGASRVKPHSDGHRNHLSMAEEARNTEERYQSWSSDLRLRHTQISFVSASTLSSTTLPKEATVKQVSSLSIAEEDAGAGVSELSMANMSIQSQSRSPPVTPELEGPRVEYVPCEPEESGTKVNTQMPGLGQSNSTFVIGSNGFDERVKTGLPPPTVLRSPSPSWSNSSEEVVLFRGRVSSGQDRGKLPARTITVHQNQVPSTPRKPNRPGHSSPAALGGLGVRPEGQVLELQMERNGSNFAQLTSGVMEKVGRATHRGPRYSHHHRRQASKQREEDDGGIADYIENMRANQEEYHSFNNVGLTRNLTDLVSSCWQDEPSEQGLKKEPYVHTNSGWSDDDLQDMNDVSTSSDIFEAVESVLSRRDRLSGRQYLVVWEGYSTDDARWVPNLSLSHHTASELIAAFDAREDLAQQLQTSGNEAYSNSSNAEQLALDLEEELGDQKDEEDLLERRRARMTDEQIARRLGTQEEMGLGSAEVILSDGDEADDSCSEANIEALLEQVVKYNCTRGPKKRGKSKQGIKFLSARAVADVLDSEPYSGFDIMDFDRPSLRKFSNGRRGALPLELSDPELEGTMLLAWENDRMKKKIQKQQREGLRAQGLLGKNGQVDIKAKYKEGMPIAALKAELKNFLQSNRESVSFPPMDKKIRIIIHTYANACGLKSRSMGVGTGRYPNVYKTSRTRPYSEAMFDKVQTRFDRTGFLPRMDKRRKRDGGDQKAGPRRAGSGMIAAVSYRDGEIVGYMAPVLGTENKGRAMLEKMGWSTGTALGALNNKGIMEPVAHIVKTTKAGLG